MLHRRLTIFLVVAIVCGSGFTALGVDVPDGAATASDAGLGTATTKPMAATRGASSRSRATRPTQSDSDYAKEALELREAYSKPTAEWPRPTLDAGVEVHELGLLPTVEYPKDNPYSKEKEALGKALFFDPRLSGSGQIACASCHDPDLAWADGRTTPFGNDRAQLRRNAPSILLSAYAKPLFWDGRASDLEDQFHSPVVSHDEMNGDIEVVEKRLGAVPEYRQTFKAVFGTETTSTDDAAKAVATYERGLAKFAGRSDFDRFLKGKRDALSDSAVRGLDVFRTVGRCMNCHNGPTFSDNRFHDLGLSYYGRTLQDLGRYDVTKDPKDVGRFRTPSLRDVGRTRPYMHNGLFDLEGVINAYNAGMATLVPRTEAQKQDPLFPKKDPLLKPLGLNAHDRADLKAFLESLSEPPLRVRPPTLPAQPSGGRAGGRDSEEN